MQCLRNISLYALESATFVYIFLWPTSREDGIDSSKFCKKFGVKVTHHTVH
jgi:hypothetical protein